MEQPIFDEETPVPTQLYRHFDAKGELLYVGISLSTMARLSQHRETSAWFRSITRVDIQEYPSREAALHAEREAIRAEKPRHNIQHACPVPSPLSKARAAKDRLSRQVLFKIMYTPTEAGAQLGLSTIIINRMIRAGEIRHVVMHGDVYITGWQMIDYIEKLQGAST
jgi:predicted GIY-YIG superfamily endonuclease